MRGATKIKLLVNDLVRMSVALLGANTALPMPVTTCS